MDTSVALPSRLPTVLSAINGSPGGILPGSAIVVKNGRAFPAGPALANAICFTGAGPKGVVTYITIGEVTLNDWSEITGTRRLTPGKNYSVGSSGRLVAGGSGQAIGIASSIVTLSVTIQTEQVQTTAPKVTSDIAALQAEILNLQLQIMVLAAQPPVGYTTMAKYGGF